MHRILSGFIDAKKPSSYILPKAFNIVLYHGAMKSKGCMLIGSNKPLHKQVYLNAVRISKNEEF